MPEVVVEHLVDATPDQVWKSWDDFGNINQFNPNLRDSFLLGDQATGLGATRQCDLIDGKNHIKERIVDYIPNKRMVLDIYDGTMPLKSAQAMITLAPQGDKTQVRMKMTFEPKFGILGAMMVPMMKPQFRKLLRGLLAGNAEFVEAKLA